MLACILFELSNQQVLTGATYPANTFYCGNSILYTIDGTYLNGVSRNLCPVFGSDFEFTQFIRISFC